MKAPGSSILKTSLLLLSVLPALSALPVSLAAARAEELGVSRELARARAARVSDLRYRLDYTLTAHAESTAAHEQITFTLAAGPQADLPLDFRDGTLGSVALNGQVVARAVVNGHLTLPAAALRPGNNHLDLVFTANVAPAGKAITRYTDRDDGKEYLYTLFVPMDADMAFPCFDQPDLKARFTLAVSAPADWQVIANTAAASEPIRTEDARHWVFSETRPISTYLFAFAAGPFARLAPTHPGEPVLYVRASQLTRAQAEAPAVQAIAARGIAYLSDYFQQPFPFPKYDLVLIPGFPFGGMEHAGATFLNEDGVLFRSTPTASDYFRRDILVLHETTHQWFGDLVTMRWFDDLWLKEGFAQYMAYKAMAQLKPETDPWKHFSEEIKPLAYGIDETEGTTPIYQNIPNLKDAKSAYGAIVYQKAPAVLKQLEYRIGDDTFRDGLRLYLKQHAYANAEWADLIHAFEQAGGKDVQAWADAWIIRRGIPQVDVAFSCSAGRVQSLTLTQHDVLPDGFTWPIAEEILFAYSADAPRAVDRLRVQWSGPRTTVAEAVGKPCPAYLFANSGDFGYGRFLLDAKSQAAVAGLLAPAPGVSQPAIAPLPDPFLRSQLWGSLWNSVRIAKTSPADYLHLALRSLPGELDESISRIQGGRMALAFHSYLGPRSRTELIAQAETVIADRMLHAPTLGLRIVSFRTFTAIAETPAALAQVKAILVPAGAAGTPVVPGLTLKPLDRWNLVGHLLAMNDPEASTLYAAEQARDHSGEAQKYAYAMAAGTPDAATKRSYFNDYLHPDQTGKPVQEDWLTQSLGPFNSWNQAALTEPYLIEALDGLPTIKRDRKIFFLGAWLGAFIDGQHSPEAQSIVHAWLVRPGTDPDLRLKVLEQSDALDRTVLIRKTYPE